MKFHTKYVTFNTKRHREYVNITSEVEEALAESGVKEGLCLVSAMHITASVYVNDAEPGLIGDIDEWLGKLAPEGVDYRHHRTGETNGDAHLKNLLVHHQVVVPFEDGGGLVATRQSQSRQQRYSGRNEAWRDEIPLISPKRPNQS